MISIQHELAKSAKPKVVLKFAGHQPGFGTLPGRDLYNVVSGDYAIGSTVTKETMEARGFQVTILAGGRES